MSQILYRNTDNENNVELQMHTKRELEKFGINFYGLFCSAPTVRISWWDNGFRYSLRVFESQSAYYLVRPARCGWSAGNDVLTVFPKRCGPVTIRKKLIERQQVGGAVGWYLRNVGEGRLVSMINVAIRMLKEKK